MAPSSTFGWFPCSIACCSFLSAFAISLTLCIYYHMLLSRAENYISMDPTYTSYDECAGAFSEDSEERTGWTQIFKFNYYLYLIFTCLAGAALLFIPCSPAGFCPVSCFFCTNLPAFVAIIISGIRLRGDIGKVCAANDTAYITGDDTSSFATDAETWRKLWITQMVLIIPASCCVGIGQYASYMAYIMVGRTTTNYFKMLFQ